MFHLKGSGLQSQPIVLGDFGASDQPMPTIDGDGFQSALLIYNDSFITVENLVFTNQASHLDSNGVVKKLPSFLGESNDWGSGKKCAIRHQGGCRCDVTRALSSETLSFMTFSLHPPTQKTSTWAMASSWKIGQIHFWAMSTPSTMLSSRMRKSHGPDIMVCGSKHSGWLGTTASKTTTFTSKDAPSHTPEDQVLSPTDVGTLW